MDSDVEQIENLSDLVKTYTDSGLGFVSQEMGWFAEATEIPDGDIISCHDSLAGTFHFNILVCRGSISIQGDGTAGTRDACMKEARKTYERFVLAAEALLANG